MRVLKGMWVGTFALALAVSACGSVEGSTSGSGADGDEPAAGGGPAACAALGGSCQTADLPCSDGTEWNGAECGLGGACCVPAVGGAGGAGGAPAAPTPTEQCEPNYSGLVLLRADYFDAFGTELWTDDDCGWATLDYGQKWLDFADEDDREMLWQAGASLPEWDRVVVRAELKARVTDDTGGDTYTGRLEVQCVASVASAVDLIDDACPDG